MRRVVDAKSELAPRLRGWMVAARALRTAVKSRLLVPGSKSPEAIFMRLLLDNTDDSKISKFFSASGSLVCNMVKRYQFFSRFLIFFHIDFTFFALPAYINNTSMLH
jgi:hypothetical protein